MTLRAQERPSFHGYTMQMGDYSSSASREQSPSALLVSGKGRNSKHSSTINFVQNSYFFFNPKRKLHYFQCCIHFQRLNEYYLSNESMHFLAILADLWGYISGTRDFPHYRRVTFDQNKIFLHRVIIKQKISPVLGLFQHNVEIQWNFDNSYSDNSCLQ